MTPKEINQKRLVKIFQDVKRLNSSETRFCFLLGAGASKSSGIPTGWELATQWYDDLLNDLEINERVAWEKKIKFDASKKGEFYPKLYEKRYESSPQLGYEEFKKLMEDKDPSIGYLILSQILTKERHNFVITTNFDYLVEDAVRMYTRTKPFSAGHELLADFISAQTERPTIIKVHRDLFLNPFNDDSQTQILKNEWKKALSPILRNFNLLVIGYGGNDGSLMDYLQDINPKDRKPIYWCKREKDSLSEKVINLLNINDYTVNIEDFDKLMYEIHGALDYNLFENLEVPQNHEFVLTSVKRIEDLREKLAIMLRSGNTVVSESSSTEGVSKTAESLFKGALDYIYKAYNEKNATKRETIFLDGLKAYPQNEDLLGAYAYFLESERKNYDEAERYYKEALSKNPENINNLGDFANFQFYIRNNPEEARKLYTKVVAIDPNNAINLGNYALFLSNDSKNLDQSEKYYKKALEKDPSNLNNLMNYASFLATIGLNKEAEKTYKKALDLYPENINLFTKYAYFLYTKLGDVKEADRFFKEKITSYPDNNLLLTNYANFLAYKLKDHAQAEKMYKIAIDKTPQYSLAFGIYGIFLTNVIKDYTAADANFKTALNLSPKDAYLLGNYAHLLLISKEDFKSADRLINEAFKYATRDNALFVELWFYRYAHFPEYRDEAEKELESLMAQGAKSYDWDFESHIKIAKQNGHPNMTKLKEFADKIFVETPKGVL